MDDPWWNVRLYLPHREVRKLFMVLTQLPTEAERRAQLLTDKLTAAAASGNVASSGSLPNSVPPADH